MQDYTYFDDNREAYDVAVYNGWLRAGEWNNDDVTRIILSVLRDAARAAGIRVADVRFKLDVEARDGFRFSGGNYFSLPGIHPADVMRSVCEVAGHALINGQGGDVWVTCYDAASEGSIDKVNLEFVYRYDRYAPWYAFIKE